jgi:hypothetical protein
MSLVVPVREHDLPVEVPVLEWQTIQNEVLPVLRRADENGCSIGTFSGYAAELREGVWNVVGSTTRY